MRLPFIHSYFRAALTRCRMAGLGRHQTYPNILSAFIRCPFMLKRLFGRERKRSCARTRPKRNTRRPGPDGRRQARLRGLRRGEAQGLHPGEASWGRPPNISKRRREHTRGTKGKESGDFLDLVGIIEDRGWQTGYEKSFIMFLWFEISEPGECF